MPGLRLLFGVVQQGAALTTRVSPHEGLIHQPVDTRLVTAAAVARQMTVGMRVLWKGASVPIVGIPIPMRLLI